MKNKAKFYWLYLIIVNWVIFIMLGCTSTLYSDKPITNDHQTISVEAQENSTQARARGSQSTQTPSPIPAIWVAPDIPESLKYPITHSMNFRLVNRSEDAQLTLRIGTDSVVSTWVYALVAPFPTIFDDVSSEQIRSIWTGKSEGDLPVKRLLVTEETKMAFDNLWGPAAETVAVLNDDQILSEAWKDRVSWAIVPFQSIEPRWKVLSVDGVSPLQKSFDVNTYPLKVDFSLTGSEVLIRKILDEKLIPETNRDDSKLTTVILTGVTALVRGTASMMEVKGLTYPAVDIRSWLREADITHISNEIPFTPKCPPPYPRENNLKFCSAPRYIELLRDVGTDVVELTGDHFQDWGPEAVLFTVDLYKQEGWNYYGGGINLDDARKPLLLEHNGNRIAFLGCNAKGPGYAGAREDQPGAALCDFDWMLQEIANLRAENYLPIVTFQHLEYYSYSAHPILQKDFRSVAEAGAVIVSGSQAHQPHAFEFVDQSLLHYGLGNLFFDQYGEGIPTRQAFIDRHVIYNGKYIGTELLTIYFVDLARPRPMTLEERRDLLEKVFTASGW